MSFEGYGFSTVFGTVNAKTVHDDDGWVSSVCYMEPGQWMCPNAVNCLGPCLRTSGRLRLPSARDVGRARTRAWRDPSMRPHFMMVAWDDLRKAARKALREGKGLSIRGNGTSDDMEWTRKVQDMVTVLRRDFYPELRIEHHEYSKVGTIPGVHTTWSYDGEVTPTGRPTKANWEWVTHQARSYGGGIAVCFDVKRGHALPESYKGLPVIDGDVTDLRFADNVDGLHVVGLRAKGLASGSAFAVKA